MGEYADVQISDVRMKITAIYKGFTHYWQLTLNISHQIFLSDFPVPIAIGIPTKKALTTNLQPLLNQRPYLFALCYLHKVAGFVHVENNNGELVFLAKGNGGHIHNL